MNPRNVDPFSVRDNPNPAPDGPPPVPQMRPILVNMSRPDSPYVPLDLAEYRRLRLCEEVLRELEWEGTQDSGDDPPLPMAACPCCGWISPYEYVGLGENVPLATGHGPDCKLARALGGAK